MAFNWENMSDVDKAHFGAALSSNEEFKATVEEQGMLTAQAEMTNEEKLTAGLVEINNKYNAAVEQASQYDPTQYTSDAFNALPKPGEEGYDPNVWASWNNDTQFAQQQRVIAEASIIELLHSLGYNNAEDLKTGVSGSKNDTFINLGIGNQIYDDPTRGFEPRGGSARDVNIIGWEDMPIGSSSLVEQGDKPSLFASPIFNLIAAIAAPFTGGWSVAIQQAARAAAGDTLHGEDYLKAILSYVNNNLDMFNGTSLADATTAEQAAFEAYDAAYEAALEGGITAAEQASIEVLAKTYNDANDILTGIITANSAAETGNAVDIILEGTQEIIDGGGIANLTNEESNNEETTNQEETTETYNNNDDITPQQENALLGWDTPPDWNILGNLFRHPTVEEVNTENSDLIEHFDRDPTKFEIEDPEEVDPDAAGGGGRRGSTPANPAAPPNETEQTEDPTQTTSPPTNTGDPDDNDGGDVENGTFIDIDEDWNIYDPDNDPDNRDGWEYLGNGTWRQIHTGEIYQDTEGNDYSENITEVGQVYRFPEHTYNPGDYTPNPVRERKLTLGGFNPFDIFTDTTDTEDTTVDTTDTTTDTTSETTENVDSNSTDSSTVDETGTDNTGGEGTERTLVLGPSGTTDGTVPGATVGDTEGPDEGPEEGVDSEGPDTGNSGRSGGSSGVSDAEWTALFPYTTLKPAQKTSLLPHINYIRSQRGKR